MSLGSRLKALRKKRGWTQGQLELYSGVNRSYVSRIERDKHPNVSGSILAELADALETTADYLTGGTDNPRRPIAERELTGREEQMLDLFRRLGPNLQSIAIEQLQLWLKYRAEREIASGAEGQPEGDGGPS